MSINKKELMDKIKALDVGKWTDHEDTHIKIDELMYEYIGFTDEEIEIIKDLCPWYS